MIDVILGNIVHVELDAIVNSANKYLIQGSGVSGAIHKAAGNELEIESRKHAPLQEGNSIITKGYNLKSKYVIHTVAPKYYMLQENREELLRNCYRTSFKIADKNNLRNIGYPAIGLGVCKWPVELALSIAIEEAMKYIANENNNIEDIYFITVNEEIKRVYESLINKFSV